MTTSSRTRHRWAVAVCTAVLAFAGVAVSTAPAGAATVASAGRSVATATHTGAIVPDTATSCGTGSSSGNVESCITVVGSGLFIDTVTASARVISSGRTIQVCIHGPQGTIGCTPFVFEGPGDPPVTLIWAPDSNEPAGDYCVNTWRLNSDGSHTQIGHQCVNVHA